jgi:peptidyl-prolyl cis-trans isomerase C
MNMKTTFKLLATAATFATITAANAQNAAVVNGKAIPSAAIDFILKSQANGQPVTPDMRKMLIEQVISMEVIAQDGAKRGVGGKDLEIELNLLKTQLMARAAVKSFQEKNPVTDAQAKAEYDKQVKTMPAGAKEYQARHILVDDEAQAKDIIAKLKTGTKFEELAKASKDTGSAAQGGDLGFADPKNYVKPFAEALVALKKGELTATPVKSEFGFHVIELTDVRDAKPPTFEEAKQEIITALAQVKLKNYTEGLRKAAVVK